MKQTPLLFSLALLGSLSLSPPAAAAETPSAQLVCAALTKSAQKAGKKADAKAKGRLALAAAIKRLEKEPENVNERSKGKGITPLMVATALGEKDAIRWLISIGADPTIKDASGKDSLARAKDDATTALLKEGAFFTWEEVQAHLNNISQDDWIQAVEAAENKELAKEFLRDISHTEWSTWCEWASSEETNASLLIDRLGTFAVLGDTKMISFLSRHLAGNDVKIFFFDRVCALTPAKRALAMLNLLTANGLDSHVNHSEELNLRIRTLATDKKLTKWAMEHLQAADLIPCGACVGSQEMIEAGIRKGTEEKYEYLHARLAKATAWAVEENHADILRFLLKQDRSEYGGCREAVEAAVRHNRLEMLKLLVDDAPRVWNGSHTYDISLHVCLLYAIDEVTQADVFNYMVEQLENVDVTQEQLQNALWGCLYKDDDNIRQGKQSSPCLEDAVRFLLKLGAAPDAHAETIRERDMHFSAGIQKLLDNAPQKPNK